jgi:hypothetical protein
VTTLSKALESSSLRYFLVKKDGAIVVNTPISRKMIPLFYQNSLESQLTKTKYLTLIIVVCLLQMHKQVSRPLAKVVAGVLWSLNKSER